MIDGSKLISVLTYIVANLDGKDPTTAGMKTAYEHVIELVKGSETSNNA